MNIVSFFAIAFAMALMLSPAWGQQSQAVCTVEGRLSLCRFPGVLTGPGVSSEFRLLNRTGVQVNAGLEMETDVRSPEKTALVSRALKIAPYGAWVGNFIPPDLRVGRGKPMSVVLVTTLAADGLPAVTGVAFVRRRAKNGVVQESSINAPLGNAPRTMLLGAIVLGEAIDTAVVVSNADGLNDVTVTVTLVNSSTPTLNVPAYGEIATAIVAVPAASVRSFTVTALFAASAKFKDFVLAIGGGPVPVVLAFASDLPVAAGISEAGRNPDGTGFGAMGRLVPLAP